MMVKHIGFSGTQRDMTKAQAEMFKKLFRNLIRGSEPYFHHGDCIGADTTAHNIVIRTPGMPYVRTIIHPPILDWKRSFCSGDEVRKPAAYLERNHDIVDECETMIVTPGEYEEQLRSGTWATYRYSIQKGRFTFLILPDGKCSVM